MPHRFARAILNSVMVFSALTGFGAFGQSPALNQVVIPRYPSLAKVAHIEGTIVIQIEVGPTGLIRLLKVEDYDKKFSTLAYAALTSVSKWRLVSHANQQLRISFVFELLPYNCKDEELETKLVLFSEIKIRDRKPSANAGITIQDPSPIK